MVMEIGHCIKIFALHLTRHFEFHNFKNTVYVTFRQLLLCPSATAVYGKNVRIHLHGKGFRRSILIRLKFGLHCLMNL